MIRGLARIRWRAAGFVVVVAVAAAVVLLRARTATREVLVADQVADGARFADALEATLARGTGRPADTASLVAGLYLQRHRLGLSSPFRLVEYVVRAHRLPPADRRRVASGILSRTAAGTGYATSPEALDLLAPDGRSLGLEHRAFIESVTVASADPRAAELALRMAYQVATAEGTVSHRAPAIAVGAIAQARDRALAMRDAQALIAAAVAGQRDPVDLAPSWRTAGRFLVEQPLREPPTPEQERTASAMLPSLTGRIPRPAAPGVARGRRESLPGGPAALATARAAQRQAAPPQAPVTVTIGGFAGYVAGAGGSPARRMARAAFLKRSTNEETLAAEYGLLRSQEGPSAEVGVVMLTTAVAMRPYAQERAWLPGDGGPSSLELQDKLGLAALEFDAAVPGAWRPYYTRMLDLVVHDIRRVVPGLDLAGLRVRFGDSPLRERALALHDPATRTVYFPVATSAGAMAHELAHDLDWQAARRKYSVSTGYRTDRSVRQYRDGLAATLERLAAGTERSRSRANGAERPTEAFARGADWIVATALGQRGILNGYLSAVQDAVITGYASATAPRRDTPETDATIVAFREITTAAPDAARWLERQYGPERHMGLADGVRRVLTAPMPRYDGRQSLALGFSGWAVGVRFLRQSGESGGWQCLLDAPSLRPRDRTAMVSAMTHAADSRVRGLLRRWGEFAEGTPDASWRVRALGGAPWRPAISDSVAREMRDALLWRASRVDDGRAGLNLAERAERRAVWEKCAAR